MMFSEINTLIDKLKDVRDSVISRNDFSVWLEQNKFRLQKSISRGHYLKLRRGDSSALVDVLIQLTEPCEKCANIYLSGFFSNAGDFEVCNEIIKKSMADGILVSIDKPNYILGAMPQYVMSEYFKCQHCGSIWELAIPDREFAGSWSRVG